MGREGLVILPAPKRDALVVECGQSAIENFERAEFFLLGRTGQPAEQRQERNGKVSETHWNQWLFADAAFRDQINGKASKPMPAFVMCAGHGRESGATMRFRRRDQ